MAAITALLTSSGAASLRSPAAAPRGFLPGSGGDDYLARDVALFLVPDGLLDVVEWVGPADDGGDLTVLDECGHCHEAVAEWPCGRGETAERCEARASRAQRGRGPVFNASRTAALSTDFTA